MIKILLTFVLAFGPAFSFAQPTRWQYIDYPADGVELFACKCSRRHKSSDMDCRCIPDSEEKRRRIEEASWLAYQKEQAILKEHQRKLAAFERAERLRQAYPNIPKDYQRWRNTEPDEFEKSWIEKSQNIKMVK